MQHEDKLGSPQIHLAGLRIWVRGRQFPEMSDYWDGNWVDVIAHCGANGADVWVAGPVIRLPEIERWADACNQMYETLSGEARLQCIEPELSVVMTMQMHGHITMEVSITPDNMNQEHWFEFEIDQSYLIEFIKQCRQVLATYPIRNG